MDTVLPAPRVRMYAPSVLSSATYTLSALSCCVGVSSARAPARISVSYPAATRVPVASVVSMVGMRLGMDS